MNEWFNKLDYYEKRIVVVLTMTVVTILLCVVLSHMVFVKNINQIEQVQEVLR